MPWTAEITIRNTSHQTCRLKIKKGQIFENKKIGTGLQNVAAAKDYTVELPPNTTQKVEIEVFCINERLSTPSGSLNVTNYFVGKDFSDQSSLWANMRP